MHAPTLGWQLATKRPTRVCSGLAHPSPSVGFSAFHNPSPHATPPRAAAPHALSAPPLTTLPCLLLHGATGVPLHLAAKLLSGKLSLFPSVSQREQAGHRLYYCDVAVRWLGQPVPGSFFPLLSLLPMHLGATRASFFPPLCCFYYAMCTNRVELNASSSAFTRGHGKYLA